jgi:enoyl-CoA hydratase
LAIASLPFDRGLVGRSIQDPPRLDQPGILPAMAHVGIDREGGIAVVRIDRPPANAMDPELVGELIAAATELRSSQPDAVVITGRDGFFSAGLDLKVVPSLDSAGRRDMIMGINRMVAAWYALLCPVVMAVSGHAIAGGIVLALCGDHRIGSTKGKLGLTEVQAGVPYPAGAIALVRAELSPPAARVLVLGGRLYDPPAALELGMLDELAEPEHLLPRALAVAGELAAHPADTYARVKAQLRGDLVAELERIVSEEDDPLVESWLSAETAQAASATLRGGRP